ncbi:LacI family DNA-binding transcriptional regulator [Roseovarius aestuarii]|nr:LacI family DNA-binding transcriptional regulator [Roseovarius aestuarii]
MRTRLRTKGNQGHGRINVKPHNAGSLNSVVSLFGESSKTGRIFIEKRNKKGFQNVSRQTMVKAQGGIPARRTTIVTLSQIAGVAPSTVTRALRGDTRISKKTRDKILALAQKHGYTPNILARTLSSGRNGLYGLVLGPSTNPFYAELMYEATALAEQLGFRILIIHAGTGSIEERTAQALLNYQVNGCIISSATMSSQAGKICDSNNVPLVMVNRVAYQSGCAVTCDNRGGGEELARHLVEKGRQSFGVIRTSNFSSTARDREEGFLTEIRNAGYDVTLRIDGKSTYEGGFAAAEQIAALPPRDRPEALFALSDIMAMGLMDGLRLKGINVPDDIAVVGFDGIPQSGRAIYDLTTLEQPLTLMLKRAFDMIEARVDDRTIPEEVITLRGRLIVRGTSG